MAGQSKPVVSKTPTPSSFLLKQVMVLTGFVFVCFVVVHLFGNLKVYQGPEAFNSYAGWLREVGYPLLPKQGVLWALRIVLLVSLVLHVYAATTIWLRGRKARGPYRRRGTKSFTASTARAMLPGGAVLFTFIVVHILDLTVGALVHPERFRHPDGAIHAYENLVASFQRPLMALFYIAVMFVLALHVEHGWRTLLQDVGATGRRLRKFWTILGGLIALAILLGNAAIPALVLIGVIA
ncbi:succinate dehydrogenase cytochrome b subunit [Tessaracoccus sp. OH4464_COT-324]|uniref:succinate dehydrogenase cytochrome b subunit n=1 Tax=Tessaracoccus sp. OH4464_COT-324 TaxID=2491059 RepID=UPI000F635679|nr:succinate dehydrogenase cytochrome b subunit [Tessaracoccus sp. OH4464_COT-324]RRD46322.1 succinate dehydrogenase cytochrome b subunit [Tessaracoccus sp. OH4464_COT-324]